MIDSLHNQKIGGDSLLSSDSSIINELTDVKWFHPWLSEFMNEKEIYSDTTQIEVYRFTWLRTFDNPIVVRIEKVNDTFMVFWKLCNGKSGYFWGQLIVDKQKVIDSITWKKFIENLNSIDFWNIKTKESETIGFDGSNWILEGKKNSKYHYINRWCGGIDRNYKECCMFLISLTDLKIKDKY